MQLRTQSTLRTAVAGTLTLFSLSAPGDTLSRTADDPPPIRALAAVHILAAGFEDPSGLAVASDGAVFVTDRARGTLTRIEQSGEQRVVMTNLLAPVGLVVDASGNVLIAEAAARRVIQLAPDGHVTQVAADFRQLRSIARAPDGRIFIALRNGADGGNVVAAGDEEGLGSEYSIARLEPSGALTVIASGFRGVQALAADRSWLYVAMMRLDAETGRRHTILARVASGDPAGAARIEALPLSGLDRPQGLAIDVDGNVFVGGTSERDRRSGVIMKRRPTDQTVTFAAGLTSAVALAFAPNGDLVAAEKAPAGCVIRFLAPRAPAPSVPSFTNQAPLPIVGRAAPAEQVEVFAVHNGIVPLATTVASDATGEFQLVVPLDRDMPNELIFTATGAGGLGLVGPRAAARVVHDGGAPTVDVIEPSPGAFLDGPFTLTARGDDTGSGIAAVAFMMDTAVMARVENQTPATTQFTAVVSLDSRAFAEGPHTLTAVAVDQAGNSGSAAQLAVIDRTPPETYITSGPAPETVQRSVTFTVSADDLYSPEVEFSWRLDDGDWSPYGASPLIALNELASGVHRFEVRARDVTGNVDLTPAAQSFTVIGLRISIIEPAEGAVLRTTTAWVRGTAEGTGPLVVRIPLPAEFQAMAPVDAVTVPVVARTFAAEVPVVPGTTELTAIVSDTQGAAANDATAVSVEAPQSPLSRLEAFPDSGLAPLAVRFGGTLPQGTYSLDLEGDGTFDYVGGGIGDREFTYADPGMHLATLLIVTPDGQASTRRTVVTVYDRPSIEVELRAAWTGFKEALQARDVPRAAGFIHNGRREAWEAYLRQFTPEMLDATATVFTDLTLLEVAAGRAECEMMREVGGLMYSYPVSFVVDADGRWRLWQF
jgi:sugar lactone lactonase YvrE